MVKKDKNKSNKKKNANQDTRNRSQKEEKPSIVDHNHEALVRSGENLLSPSHWPKGVLYLGWHSQPSNKLSQKHQLTFCIAPRITHEAHPSQIRAHQWTEVRSITSSSSFVPAFGSNLTCHPAVGQCGLFAKKMIPPRTLVVPYYGLVHLAGEEEGDEDVESRYDAAIEADDGTKLGIDATCMGTEARFVNDYRGILQRPNLFFQEWTAAFPKELLSIYSTHQKGSNGSNSDVEVPFKLPNQIRGLAMYSGAHPISPGTELCVSYGKGWWAARKGEESEND